MKILGFLLVLVVLVAAAAGYLLFIPVTPPGETFVDFPSGTTSTEMAQKLEDAHVLRSRYAFLILRVWKGGTMKAGEYRFADPETAESVYSRIRKGDVYTKAVVIPEGFSLFDIANAVQSAGLGTADAFLQAARTNTDLIAEWAPGATSLEGYLYPDTYRFSHHSTPRSMQETMVRRFRQEMTKQGLDRPTKLLCLGHCLATIPEIVTLASLVEKEVRYDDERTQAAGVFMNRLNNNMPLQTDPTVIYAAQQVGRWSGVIHRSDLDFDSPYNTYKHTGLPPGPICSPGAAALRAAIHPATTDNLYFVADKNGHTTFSATLQEHNEQVEVYRRLMQNGH